MYFTKKISDDPQSIHIALKGLSHTNKIVLVSIFSGFAAIFQAAGGFMPGIGYFISPLATAPIIFCSILSKRLGFLSYLITNFMLLISQPSELIVFPFTTGLLGLGIGIAFLMYKKRLAVMASGFAALTLGILAVLYGFKFPLLGPAASTSINGLIIISICLFSAFYSWIWVEISVACFKRIRAVTAS
ncbi:hypothetical protein [Lederbergia citrea]|uniref:Uncharacterized protein n=1 Tax=Lederbergia citrea TaxID=2833581 RepID=A0A942Z622_9BACI|nr:hypothetical protein [Lederbergia citrea]MBS4223546.1 hypothetical protein [Lederbergia citrea]